MDRVVRCPGSTHQPRRVGPWPDPGRRAECRGDAAPLGTAVPRIPPGADR